MPLREFITEAEWEEIARHLPSLSADKLYEIRYNIDWGKSTFSDMSASRKQLGSTSDIRDRLIRIADSIDDLLKALESETDKGESLFFRDTGFSPELSDLTPEYLSFLGALHEVEANARERAVTFKNTLHAILINEGSERMASIRITERAIKIWRFYVGPVPISRSGPFVRFACAIHKIYGDGSPNPHTLLQRIRQRHVRKQTIPKE